MDTCVICGEYTPEGRQVCPTCELTKSKEYIQVMGKKTDTLIIPGGLPDLNQIIDLAKTHWSKYREIKSEETESVAWMAKVNIHRQYKNIDLDITWYCKDRRKDKDNIAAGIKFILDGLVEAGVIQNDGWKNVNSFRHNFDVDKQNPRIEVKITEVG